MNPKQGGSSMAIGSKLLFRFTVSKNNYNQLKLESMGLFSESQAQHNLVQPLGTRQQSAFSLVVLFKVRAIHK